MSDTMCVSEAKNLSMAVMMGRLGSLARTVLGDTDAALLNEVRARLQAIHEFAIDVSNDPKMPALQITKGLEDRLNGHWWVKR